MSMAELQIFIETCGDSVLRLRFADFLEGPELVDVTMTLVLNDARALFEFASTNIKVHLVEVTLNDVDFTGFVDVPSLIVPVVGLINNQLYSFLY